MLNRSKNGRSTANVPESQTDAPARVLSGAHLDSAVPRFVQPAFVDAAAVEYARVLLEARNAESARDKQRRRAREPRPSRRSPLRQAVIKGMRASRREGRTLEQFIAAACKGSVELIKFEPTEKGHSVEAGDHAGDVTHRTLLSWWTSAGKSPTT